MSDQTVRSTLKQLQKENVRITPQRQAILQFMIESHAHPTADDIYQSLNPTYPNMSVATVYNNLRLFTKLGIIEEMSYGDSSSRFDFAETEHYHAICENCGKIVDIFYPGMDEVETVAANLTGFKVSSHRMEVYGLCPDCQKKLAKQV